MRKPLQADFTATSYWRHHQKKVFAQRVLDDMSSDAAWSLLGSPAYGAFHTAERDGKKVMRLTAPVISDNPSKDPGRGWGATTLFRAFPNEDWSDYTRIAFEVYPDLPGFRVVSLCLYLYTDDDWELPKEAIREGVHFIILKNHAWNHCTWEIPDLKRDRIRGFGFQYRLQSSEPGAAKEVQYDFASLRLEKVDPDQTKGWLPKKGDISFSHTGYTPDSQKSAVAVGLEGEEFQLIRSEDGFIAYTGKIEEKQFPTGRYQILDFSAFEEEGLYFLKAGASITRPFRIDKDVWKSTIEKDINFFFAERCGYAVPGVHDICHSDLRGRHEGFTKALNGGWHDAGDLSQGLINSSEAAYSMISLAEQVKASDPALYELLIEEVRWGQDWVLKTRFWDGYRVSWLTMDFWSDGVEGNKDDVTFDATRVAYSNLVAAASEARCARAFLEDDAPFALRNRTAAEEDFRWAEEDIAKEWPEGDREKALGGCELNIASQAALAALELYLTSRCPEYLEKAAQYADKIAACQQTELPEGWEKPVRGFFYTDSTHAKLLHFPHRSHEQAPLVAMQKLLAAAPEHAKAAVWKNTLALYAEYIKFTAAYTQPWGMLPAGVYSLDEASDNVGKRGSLGCPTENAARQIKNGFRLSEKYYLRCFPVWYTFRGNCGITLTICRAALACAEALKDRELAEICRRQLEWTVGRNPFNQSLIWGEGYNFTPQYTAMSGDIVGSFPVGVEAQHDEDEPYYPDANCYNYKEVWVQPAARWFWLMESLYHLDF